MSPRIEEGVPGRPALGSEQLDYKIFLRDSDR